MKLVSLVFAVCCIIGGIMLITGDGAFKKKMTMSGIVTVDIPHKKVTCFVDSEAHGIACLPNWFIDGKQIK